MGLKNILVLFVLLIILKDIQGNDKPTQNADEAISKLKDFVHGKLQNISDLLNVHDRELIDEIQNALEGRNIFFIDYFTEARELIKLKATLPSGKVNEKCVLETEAEFLKLFHQLSNSQRTCVTGKVLNLLHTIDDTKQSIIDILVITNQLSKQFDECSNTGKNTTACLDHVIEKANNKIEEAKKIEEIVNKIIADVKEAPKKIELCSDSIVNFSKIKINKIVESVNVCMKME